MQSYLCEYVKIMKEKYKLEHIPCLLQSKVSERAQKFVLRIKSQLTWHLYLSLRSFHPVQTEQTAMGTML